MSRSELSDTQTPHIPLSSRKRWAITAGVMVGMFLAALEATVVGTAMPTVIATLGGLNHYSWVFSAYLLTSTVTVPVWGKLSDLYGRRLLYEWGVGIFLVGSTLSGVATSMPQLIVFRAIQGLGAGALVPIAMTIVGEIYTVQERARMQAFFSGVWGVASIIGPIVGGFLTDQLSWRWVFFINLPFGFLSAAILHVNLIEPKPVQRPKIDYAGAITLTLGVLLLLLGLVESGTFAELTQPRTLALFGGAIFLLSWFVYIETKSAEPILPLKLFSNRVVAVSVVGGFLAGVAMFGAVSYLPLYAQGTRGSTATQAGSLLTPLLLSWVTMSVVGGRLLLKVGYRPTALAGAILLTISFAILASFDRSTTAFWLYADLALLGAGLGLMLLTLLIAVQQAVPRTLLGTATSLNQFSRSIGGAIGVAVMGAFLSSGLASNLLKASSDPGSGMSAQEAIRLAENPSALVDATSRASLTAPELEILQTALSDALQSVFGVGVIVCALSALVVLRLPSAAQQKPSPKACNSSSGERMVLSEMAHLDADSEPVVVDD